jgi:hypothetical protein
VWCSTVLMHTFYSKHGIRDLSINKAAKQKLMRKTEIAQRMLSTLPKVGTCQSLAWHACMAVIGKGCCV